MQIKGNGMLIAVDLMPPRMAVIGLLLFPAAAQETKQSGILNLDDLRAEVSQDPAAVRTGPTVREVDDMDAVKRQARH